MSQPSTSIEEFAKVLALLAALYPRFKLTSDTIKAYYAILGEIEIDLLKSAALHVGANNTFFPSASELRKAAFELVEQAEGIPNAYDAWGEITAAFRSIGSYQMPDWSYPAIGEAVEMVGGWRQLCASTMPVADRARFVEAYQSLQKRRRVQRQMLPQVRDMVQRLALAWSGDKQKQLASKGATDD